jgi:predicted nucleic acid-binding protein
MIYADLPTGNTIFVDAGPFIHHFEPNPLYVPPSTSFLERIENKEIDGVTTTHIVSEVAHRLMTIEAMQTFGWKSAGIALKLRNHPSEVQTLRRFRRAIQEIPLFGVRITVIDLTWPDLAAGITQLSGLLHNDALVIAAMRALGVTNLASADLDFDRVAGITRYGPA